MKEQNQEEKDRDLIKTPKIQYEWVDVDNYEENVKTFHTVQPFFYDRKNLFWLWNKDNYYWRMADDVDLLNALRTELNFQNSMFKPYYKSVYLEAMKQYGRKRIPQDMPKTCVQFNDTIYDIQSDFVAKAIPSVFVCNPIPHNMGKSMETPQIDALLRSWVPENKVQQMYELLAYCCLPDLPIHSIFVFIGTGSNGKDKFLKLVRRFIGESNSCSSTLSNLTDNRFAISNLYRKLCCFMGETPMGIIKNTDILKQISGQSWVNLEIKYKSSFQEVLYTKILMSTNSLPTTDDNSDGFFRRWHIIEFPNKFKQGSCPVDAIPEEELENLAAKSIPLLRRLIQDCSFTNQGTIEDQRQTYTLASNPISIFMSHKWCQRGYSEYHYCLFGELFTSYNQWLSIQKRRKVSFKEFRTVLGDEGLQFERTTIDGRSSNYIRGLTFNLDMFHKYVEEQSNQENVSNVRNVLSNNYSLYNGISCKTIHSVHNLHFSQVKPQLEWSDDWIIHVKCSIDGCKSKECNLNVSDTPLCKKHFYGQRD